MIAENISETQECIISQTGQIISLQPDAQEIIETTEPTPTPEKTLPQQPPPPLEPQREIPRVVPGFLALCKYCGYLSEHFNKCQRCRTKMPDEPKAIPMQNNVAKQQAESKKELPKPNASSTPLNKCPSPMRTFPSKGNGMQI